MATLSAAERAIAYGDFVGVLCRTPGETITITKADLIAAVTAADVWLDNNAAAYNSAIPQPARGALTARQKARLLMAVIKRRYEVS